MLSFLKLSVLAALAVVVVGDNTYTDNDVNNNRGYVAMDNAPFWHLATGSCYPQSALTSSAGQTAGNGQSNCLPADQPNGCQNPGTWNGANTRGTSFPTYWTARKCGDNWRFIYSIYFRHDQGHSSDWEYIMVNLKKNSAGRWARESIALGQHGQRDWKWYGDITTWNSWSDNINNDSQRWGNHPKIYVAKYSHAMWHTINRNNKNVCVGIGQKETEFRVNDYYFPAADNLVGGQAIPVGWDWGKATSAPMVTFAEVCNW